MSQAEAYRIADEPRPTRISRVVINPFIILLLSMVFMVFLGPVWLLFNSFAMGSPRARHELLVVVASVVFFLVLLVGYVVSPGLVPSVDTDIGPYIALFFRAYWIGVCYYLFMSQMKIYPIFQYFRQRAAGQAAGA